MDITSKNTATQKIEKELIKNLEINKKLSEENLRRLYLRKLALGEIQGPMTGKASQDMPWLKFLTEDAVVADLPKKTIYQELVDNNKDRYDNDALEFFGNKITYKKLLKQIDKTAKGLIKLGVKEGEIVTVCMPSMPETTYMLYALNKIGAVINAIDPRTNAEGIKNYLNEVNSSKMLMFDACYPNVKKIIDETNLDKVISINVETSFKTGLKILFKAKKILDGTIKKEKKIYEDTRFIKWEKFIKDGKKEKIIEVPYKEKSVVGIVHTGGTTGMPKSVVLGNDAFNAMVRMHEVEGMDLTDKHTFLELIPPFAAYGMCNSLHLPLSFGMKVIQIPKFEAKDFSKLIKKHKPNHILGVPAYWESMIKDENIGDLSFLSTAVAGGDMIVPEFEEKINKYLEEHGAKIKVSKGYGMSEVCACACYSKPTVNKISTVGVPLSKNVVAAFDPDTKQEMNYNEQGEICITSPTTMYGYYNNEELNKTLFKEHENGEIWVHTGDLGYVDEDGRVFVNGRIKRLIVRFDGYKIYPSSVENVIAKHPAVHLCAVIGTEKDNLGRMPKAYIILKEEYYYNVAQIKNEINELCINNLPERAVPESYEFVEDIPLTAIGKIDFKKLEESDKENKKVLLKK